MKVLFASDLSFNYFSEFPGERDAMNAFAEAAEYFKKADFSVVNLENILGNKEDHTPIPKDGPNLMSAEDFIRYIDALTPLCGRSCQQSLARLRS